jgi:hypothetical protein
VKFQICKGVKLLTFSKTLFLALYAYTSYVYGAMRNAYKIFVGKPVGKRPLRIPQCEWEDNVIMDLGEIVWEGVDWINLTQDGDNWQALVNPVRNLKILRV